MAGYDADVMRKAMAPDSDEPDADDEGGASDSDGDELPPEFSAAASEVWDAVQNGDQDAFAGALKRAIHACTDSYGGGKGAGLDILIGSPKKGAKK